MHNVMQLQSGRAQPFQIDSGRYARCIQVSRRIRWEIDRDVIRGRSFELAKKFLPDGLSMIGDLEFLTEGEQKLLSHIQGRTYASMFGLVERYIGTKMLELTREHALGDQIALEALVRFTDEDIKHQEHFRRIEELIGKDMPEGYRFVAHPNDVAGLVLGKSTWAVLALTCMIELFTQAHYRESIAPDPDLSELYKDVFLFHWKEESQHAILDELEWRRVDAALTPRERDDAVNDLIALVAAIDGTLQAQSKSDADYFLGLCTRSLSPKQIARVRPGILRAYRWQYIFSGAEDKRFRSILRSMVSEEQGERIANALASVAAAMKPSGR